MDLALDNFRFVISHSAYLWPYIIGCVLIGFWLGHATFYRWAKQWSYQVAEKKRIQNQLTGSQMNSILGGSAEKKAEPEEDEFIKEPEIVEDEVEDEEIAEPEEEPQPSVVEADCDDEPIEEEEQVVAEEEPDEDVEEEAELVAASATVADHHEVPSVDADGDDASSTPMHYEEKLGIHVYVDKPADADYLTVLEGINSSTEARLNRGGIYKVEQLAAVEEGRRSFFERKFRIYQPHWEDWFSNLSSREGADLKIESNSESSLVSVSSVQEEEVRSESEIRKEVPQVAYSEVEENHIVSVSSDYDFDYHGGDVDISCPAVYNIFVDSEGNLATDAAPVLDEASQAIYEAPSHATVMVEGHSQEDGSTEYNRLLSLAWAQNVADGLTERGINRDMMKVVGLGASGSTLPPDPDEYRWVSIQVQD